MENLSHQIKWIHTYDTEKPHLLIEFNMKNRKGAVITHGALHVFDLNWGDLSFASEEMSPPVREAVDIAQEQLESASRIAILESTAFTDHATDHDLSADIAEELTHYLQTVLLVHMIIIIVPSNREPEQKARSFFDSFQSLGFDLVTQETANTYLISKLDIGNDSNDSCRFL